MALKRTTKYKNADSEAAAKYVKLVAMNEKQQEYIDALSNHDQLIVLGPSGTGKSYIAATYAANLYLQKKIHKIIITRPNVAVGRDLGHLPGTMEEKYSPWLAPILDTLEKHLGKAVVETALKNGNIEMAPLAFMRGRSFDNAMLLLDEFQNTSVEEFKMFITRVGQDCKVVMNGDIKQSDIRGQSGLAKAIDLAKKYNIDAAVIEFTLDDVVRSDICKQWLTAFYGEAL